MRVCVGVILLRVKVKNAIITSGGGKNKMVRVTLPKEWADELKINKENPGLKLSFDGEKIMIEKV